MRSTFKLLLAALLWLPMLASAQPNFDDMPEVKVSAKLSGAEFVPGQRGFVAVVLDHGPELHSWPSLEQDVLPPELAEFAIRTEVSVEGAPDWLSVGPVQWPEPLPAEVPNITGTGSMEALTYKDRALVYVPILLSEDAPLGEHEIRVSIGLQACDEAQCYIPQQDVRKLTVNIVAEGGGQLEDPDFAGFDASVFDKPWADAGGSGDVQSQEDAETEAVTPAATGRPKFLGLVELPAPGSSAFLVAIAAASMVGGFVLNLTPCVLPVIPIKIMTLTHHAGESRSRALVLGLWMALGVIAFWSALAIPVLFIKGMADPSVIFGIWWLTSGIGLVIIVMAAGLMGLFQIKLPQKAYMVNPSVDSAQGSFMFGVMTAVLGLPCFGFVVGALLPAAATAGAGVVLTVFVSMGVGMALPYFVLALFPGMLKKVPRTGPASELVKQVMGLLLMAAGAYFIGAGMLALVAEMPYMGKVLHWWAAGLCVAFAGVWLVYRTARITKSMLPRLSMLVLAVLLSFAGIWVARNQTEQSLSRWQEKEAARQMQLAAGGYVTGAWNEYSPELVEAAIADGKVVVMDFTAEWCLNCKALKAAVLNVEPVKGRLMSEEVVAFEVDLTSRSAPGWQKLRELGQTGIPTLAVYGPGQEGGPWIANAYGSGQVISAIEAAAGAEATQVTAR
ncbi:MAG: protein-disulfide reductase DsbD family protein [Phycisphaerales bacterium JB061]